MWQSKREISRECNDIIGSGKGSQIRKKYRGEVGKEKRVDAYLEVRKRRGHIFFEILSLTQLYHYTPEIFLFSTATFKYTYRAPLRRIGQEYSLEQLSVF
jgi:hypothetical protein